METVKVDIQKLQLLNDRIAQTIEALNQVRLSVQASQSHASPMATPWGYPQPFGVYGQPQVTGQPTFVGQPSFQPGYGSPYASPYGMTPFVSPQAYGSHQGFGGIQHTSPTTTTTPTWTTPQTGWTTPWMSNGLSHTTWDPTWQRTQQTFPWVQYPFMVW